jgi:hypothetical protein
MRDDETAAEQTLQLSISLKRIAGGPAASNTIGNIPEGDRAVAYGADDLVIRPEVLGFGPISPPRPPLSSGIRIGAANLTIGGDGSCSPIWLEGPRVCRLAAGGSRIRTLSPT